MAKWLFDPGHGGYDPGATYKGREEDNDVLRVANRVREIMEFNGETIEFTRVRDEFISLDARCIKENRGKYDAFASFHRNAFKPEEAFGVETYSYATTGNGRRLSELVQAEVNQIFHDRKCKTANFQVLRETRCPAILMELGFIDNTNDNKIFDEQFENMARAIARGMLKYVGKELRLPENKPPVEGNYVWRVVAGSYKDRAMAVKQQADIKAKGFDSFLAAFEKDGVTYLRVVVGSYSSIENAREQIAKLQAAGIEAFADKHYL